MVQSEFGGLFGPKMCRSSRPVVAMLGLLAATGSAVAAAPHYTLFSTFPPANSGAQMNQPQAIIIGQDGYVYGMATGGGYYGRGGVFAIRPNGILDSEDDFGGDQASGLGWITPPEPPYNQFSPLAMLLDGRFVGVTNLGGVLFVQSGATGAYTKLHTFAQANGEPTSPLSVAVGVDGNFYGLATGGSWSNGTTTSTADLFSVTQSGSVDTVFSFHSFAPTTFTLGADDSMYVTLPNGVVLPDAGGATSTGDVIYKVTSDGTGSVIRRAGSGDRRPDG